MRWLAPSGSVRAWGALVGATALVLGGVAGCHELLGLDGVSYREPVVDAGFDAGGGEGGAAGGGGSGGGELTGQPEWARRVGDDADQGGLTVSFNSAGNVIVAGKLDGSATFHGDPMSNAQGSPDVMVLGFGPFGAELWGRSFGANPWVWGSSTVAGTNTIVAGRYDGALVNPGDGPLPDPSPDLVPANGDIYVVKYDDEGDFKWRLTGGAEGEDAAYSVATWGSSDVFIAGSFSATVSFGLDELVSYGGLDAFVARVNDESNGASFAWAQAFGEADHDLRVRGPATAPVGDLVVLTHQVLLDDPMGTAGDLSVRRIAGDDGAPVWTVPVHFSAGLHVGAVAVDPADHVLLAATFSGTVTTPVGELLSNGAVDLLLARLKPDGTVQWVHQYPSDGSVSATCVAADGVGNVILAGSLQGSLDLDGTVLSAPSSSHAFIAKLNSAGVLLWARSFGDEEGKAAAFGAGCAAAPTGEALLTGKMQGTIHFGSNVLTAAEGSDLFVVKLMP
ncbi:MAG: hypothetical protein JRI68_00115 [Deltaproteobacteria bacterium]|nr:hypothetical protein [Deltaproteobacteria bacterium]